MRNLLGFALASLVLTACTSLEGRPIPKGSTSIVPDGLVYYLPAKAFDVGITFEITGCDVKNTSATFNYTIEATVTEQLVADTSHAYSIRYEDLNALTKVTSFDVTLYENGTPKGINTSVDDRSAQVITATAETVGRIARAVSLGTFFSAPTGGATRASVCSKALIDTLARRDALIRQIREGKDEDKARSEAAESVSKALEQVAKAQTQEEAIAKNGTAEEKKAAAERTSTAQKVLTVRRTELGKLGTSQQESRTAELAALRASLSEAVRITFKPSAQDETTTIKYPSSAYRKLVTDPQKLNPDEPIIATVIVKSYGAKPDFPQVSGTTPPGLVYRQPLSAQLYVCPGACSFQDGAYNSVFNKQYLLPQFGAIGVLTLKNKMFDKNGLAISVLPDGTVTTLKFASEAKLERLAESAKASSQTYLDTVKGLISERREELIKEGEDRERILKEAKATREEQAAVRGEQLDQLKDARERIRLLRDVERDRAGTSDRVQQQIDANVLQGQLLQSQKELLKKQRELDEEKNK